MDSIINLLNLIFEQSYGKVEIEYRGANVPIPVEYMQFKQDSDAYVNNASTIKRIKSSNPGLQLLLEISATSTKTKKLYETLDCIIHKYIDNKTVDECELDHKLLYVGIVTNGGVKSINVNMELSDEIYNPNGSLLNCKESDSNLAKQLGFFVFGKNISNNISTSVKNPDNSGKNRNVNVAKSNVEPINYAKLQPFIHELIKDNNAYAVNGFNNKFAEKYGIIPTDITNILAIETILKQDLYKNTAQIINDWMNYKFSHYNIKTKNELLNRITTASNSASSEIDIGIRNLNGIINDIKQQTKYKKIIYDNTLIQTALHSIKTKLEKTKGGGKLRHRNRTRKLTKKRKYKKHKSTKKKRKV